MDQTNRSDSRSSHPVPNGALMDSSASLSELVRRLRNGNDTLANELVHRFAHRLIGLARSHLNSRTAGLLLQVVENAIDMLHGIGTAYRLHKITKKLVSGLRTSICPNGSGR